MKSLVRSLQKICDKQSFEVGWHLKNLQTGETANRNGDDVVSSASVRKIAILMAALKSVNEGKLSLSQSVVIQRKYQKNRSGCFQYLQPGFTITLQDVLVMMIIVSDNTCTGTLVDMLGVEYINSFSRKIGLKGTKIKRGFPPLGKEDLKKFMDTTTPNDIGLLLDLIVQGSQDSQVAAKLGSTPELCQLALNILSWQVHNSMLPLLLPRGTTIAHKTGTRRGVHNDAGVVYVNGKPSFILAVFVHEGATSPQKAEAAKVIAKICKTCYDSIARTEYQ